MRKNMVKFAAFLTAFALVAVPFGSESVQAKEHKTHSAKTYTVTYRAGDVGVFDTELLDCYELTDEYTMEYTENYIRITAPKGTTASDLQELEAVAIAANVVDEGYELLSNTDASSVSTAEDGTEVTTTTEASWGVASLDDSAYTVTRNTDFVLDYGVIVDGVSYTIKYVDAASGEQLAPAYIAKGSAGSVITRSPIGISGYATSDGAKSITLAADGDNTITFYYSSTYSAGTVTRTLVNYVALPDTVLYANPEAAQGAADDAAGGAAAAGAAAGGAGGAGEGAGGAEEGVTIEDEESATNEGLEDAGASEETTSIEDEESATDDTFATEEGLISNSSPFMTMMIAIILIVIGCDAFLLYRNYKTKKNDEIDE